MTQVVLQLPIELTNGNTGRTKHWGSAAKRRREHEIIILTLYPRPQPVATPAKLTITRLLGKGQSLYDADSLGRGNAKELVDALVAVGFLPDDGPGFVVDCQYRQDASRRREGPATMIEIETVTT